VTDFVGVANTPNTYRWPTTPGLALIGDAAMASDYIWGVGCGWALQSAEFLVNHAAPALVTGGDLDAALVAYANEHKEKLYPQHAQNCAFSASDKLPALQRGLFSAAVHDARLRELLRMSLRGKVGPRDLRVPLRVALYYVMKPFRRAASATLVPQRA
jgi:flavin-dependent dehydrogenase